MNSCSIVSGKSATEIYPGVPFVDSNGIQRPGNWLENASKPERRAGGVFSITEPPEPPLGKVNRILGLEIVGGMPTRTFIVEDAPAPEPVVFTVYKADIWRRSTDAEADKLDAAIRAQPVRLRRLFDDATNLRSDDELFGQISGAVQALLGAERAATILAPSEEF